MRIRDWEDWRFHWPGRYRDVMRQPRDFLLGEELPLKAADGISRKPAKAVWLEPPADMGRPVWRDVLEQIQLGPHERAAVLAVRQRTSATARTSSGGGSPPRKQPGGSGSKQAARPSYPADLAIVPDQHGRPTLLSLANPDTPAAAVSIACSKASPSPSRIARSPRPTGNRRPRRSLTSRRCFETSRLHGRRTALLARTSARSRARMDRAVCRAPRRPLQGARARMAGNSCEITDADASSGVVAVKLGAQADRVAGQFLGRCPCMSRLIGEPTMSGPGPASVEKEQTRDFRPIPNRNPGRHHRDSLRADGRRPWAARSARKPASSPTWASPRSTPSSSPKRFRNTTVARSRFMS